MKLVTAPSKTEQVTDFLRTNIRKGKLMPGSKLKSVRDLADQFQISKRIVTCAFEQLEKEKLIRREHGRGVFVEDIGKDDEIDVYMLLWGVKSEPNNYFDELIKISYQPILRDGFSFLVRTVVADTEEYKDLDREIARIKNMPQIKCVLINTFPFKEEQIKKLKALPCPVVFFGDSAFCSLNDISFNQVTGNNKAMGEKCLHFMQEKGYSEITLFTLSQECYFYQLFCEGVMEQAEKFDIDVALYELPPEIHSLPANKASEIYDEFVSDANQNGHLNRPIVINALKKQYFVTAAEKFTRMTDTAPVILPEFSSEYFGKFYDAIFGALKNAAHNPKQIQKQLIDIDFVINDWVTKKKTLARDNSFEQIN